MATALIDKLLNPSSSVVDDEPLPPSNEKMCAIITRTCERQNLMLLTKLVVKALLEHCMKQSKNRLMPPEQPELIDLTIMLEKVLRHGFKSNRAMMSLRTPDQELWAMLERIARIKTDMAESIHCVNQLPHVQSALCRVRAWLRLSIMQKRLGDYFQSIIECHQIITEYYDPWAILRDETTSVHLSGCLIGVKVVDCNLCLKETNMTYQPLSVDLGRYIHLKSIEVDEPMTDGDAVCEKNQRSRITNDLEEQLQATLDQKHFLEERNNQLQANVANLERRMELIDSLRHNYETDPGEQAAEINAESVNFSANNDKVHVEELSRLHASANSQQDTIDELTSQLDDVKKINVDLYQKLRAAEDRCKNQEKLAKESAKTLEKERTLWQNKAMKHDNQITDLSSTCAKAEERTEIVRRELSKKTDALTLCETQLHALQQQSHQLSTNGNIERQTRETLETQLEGLKSSLSEANSAKETANELRKQLADQTALVLDYERTLEEMGVHLSQSKLKVEDMREGIQPLIEAAWTDDKEVKTCKLCESAFSTTKRRHHCRNCGGIFCAQCSANNMALASSSKPERVCDQCYQLLLQRYSKQPPADK